METFTVAALQTVSVKIPVVARINGYLILGLIISYVESIGWKEIISK